MSDTAEAKYKYEASRKLGATGTSRDERVLVLLAALGELLRVTGNWAAVGYPQREQEEKSRVGKSEYTTCTQQVYHKLWGSKVGWLNCISF